MEAPPRPNFFIASEAPRDAWRAAIAERPLSHPKLLPEVALDPAPGGPERLLFWRASAQGELPRSLAVLERRRLRLVRLPALGSLTRLPALRVVGSDLFGEVESDDAEAFVGAACALLERRRADCILFDDLATDSPLRAPLAEAEARGRARAFTPSPPQPHWYIHFPSPASAYWNTLSGKARYKLRRKARGLDHRLVKITSPGEVAPFLRKARHISERSWQGRRLGLRVTATREEIRRAENLASAGALRSYLLEVEGQPAAFVLGSQWRGRYRHEETAYDTALADRSPGIVLLYRLLEDLVEDDPPEILDFGAGDAEYKRSFANVRAESGPVALLRRGGYPRAAYGLASAYAALDRRARGALRRAGVYEKARRLYRGRA